MTVPSYLPKDIPARNRHVFAVWDDTNEQWVAQTGDANGFANNTDFLLEVQKGNVAKHSTIHKFGRNPDIDMASGFEAIWNGGGDYTGHDPTGAEIVEVVSSSVNDGAGDSSGALTVELFGLNGDYNLINEVVTLNGDTAVDSTKTFLRLFRVIVRTAGSAGSNIGTLTVDQKTSGDIFAVVPIGYNQTMIAAYTIPAGKTGYLSSWFAATAKKQAGFSNVRLLFRPINEVFQVKEELTIATTGSSYIQRIYHVFKNTLLAKTDIKIMADTSADNAGVSAGFDLLLVDD